MSHRFDCRDSGAREHAQNAVTAALAGDELVVLPMEAVYGPLSEADRSTVVDVAGGQAHVLRPGAVPVAELCDVAGTDRIELAIAEATGR